MAETPSLTPHRDAIEKLIAGMDEADNWIEAVSNAMTVAIHRAIADQRDAGVAQTELAEHFPKIVRAVAINGLAAIGAVNPVQMSSRFCMLAAGPAAMPDEVSLNTQEIDLRAVGGGQA